MAAIFSRFGRTEKRSALSVIVRIVSLERRSLDDSGISQNVSLFGLRALVGNRWLPLGPVAVESPPGVFRSRARVIYCDPAEDGGFAVGLRLSTPQLGWSSKSEEKPARDLRDAERELSTGNRR